jgi:NitT/TauT family transport system substrate-binding protein
MDSIGETLESMNIKTVVVGDAGPVMANALTSGQIDAFAGGSSDRNNIVAAGLQIRNITPAEVSENPANNYAISDKDLEASWPLKFLRTYAMGQTAGPMDTRAIMAICRKLVPEQWEKTEVGERLVNDAVYIYQVSRSRLRGEIRPWIWEKIQGPYIKIGELDQLVPATQFTDSRFLEDANTFETKDVYDAIQAWKEANPDALNW